MASCFFLLRQFDDVLIYLNSVKVSKSYNYLVYIHICLFITISKGGYFIKCHGKSSDRASDF